ncbi:hypothetical protein BJ875DRAFT_442183 [Amylocarpus encephaloides]|uniref:Tat pathway signal sequence protein n=1 Tax=Amylocarpus encephaloides TaxID=45428 RepID=A0A9P8C4G8_9HELO|nr:hypothetical protein BJ875DRAFT_442183 [Amylocarpus encephaloides]
MDKSREKLLHDDDVVEVVDGEEVQERGRSGKKYSSFSRFILFLSLAANFVFLLKNFSHPTLGPVSKSKYAGLTNDVDIPYAWDTDRSNPNDTERNALWYEDGESNEGILAMDYEEAEMFGLEKSQPWPWDKKKSIHITNGHHNMHCLRNIYISINEYSQGIPQSLERMHVLHCLGALYDDIKCNADDTPRFTHKVGLRPGEGQIRKCRDWSKLRAWVKERDGCFKYIKHDVKDISTIERMKYCSNDSKYLPKIRKFFGYPEDWTPWPYVEQVDYLKKEDE